MPADIVEQLETQVVAMQFSLCSKQKQMQDYFKSSPRAPTPSKEPRAPTPIKDVSFKMVADATWMTWNLNPLIQTIASVATSALMKETPTRFSTPKCSHTPATESSTPLTPTCMTTLYKYIYIYSIPTPCQENET